MPIITDKKQVLELYAEAAEKNWVLPTFNSENLTSTEAILSATKEYGDSIGIENLPIIIGITVNYSFRSQAVLYSHVRQWELGLKLFMNDLKLLTEGGSPYSKVRVMVHLDHVEWDINKEFLQNWDMHQFSSIMYDASNLSLDENIIKTASFVKKNKNKILIEGACDEIGKSSNSYTTPEMAEKYNGETGVDILVANLGTEHRADAATLKYQDELARKITQQIGGKLCLHGTSSVASDSLGELFHDGIRKVNIWTALERDTSPKLFEDMLKNASKILGSKTAQEWVASGLLGNKADDTSAMSVDFITTTYRQQLIFENMKVVVREYLKIWYK